MNYRSSCSLNCWDVCGFSVTVENGVVVRVDGDASHPITKGKICGRGRMLEARTNHPERLTKPLKKVNGTFQEISWDTALNEIAEHMQIIKDTVGTTAILHSHDYANGGLLKNLDKRFFNCYGGVTEIIGSVCWGSGIESQTWDFGSAYSHAPEDIQHSNHIIIWGRNVARTNMHLFERLQEAKKRGATITVIDPIFNETAKIATNYIPIHPGMDGLFAIGVMKELLRLQCYNKKFIENHTVGFKDLEQLLHSISMEDIQRPTNVSHETFTEIAKIYADKPVVTYLGLGMQRYANGGNTVRLIDALVAMSGNVGIAGGGANYASLQVGQSFNMKELTLPKRKKSSRAFTMMKQAEGILNAKDPEIEMIIVTCGNPLTQVPQTKKVEEAFNSVKTIVVLEQFMTDTAQLADYVLPVATVFEEEDIYYSSMYHAYMNYADAIVQPIGEAKSDLWIWTELSNRLGFGKDFNFTRDQFFEMGIGHLNISLEKLKEENHLLLPIESIPWKDFKFKTHSGKYEFTASRAKIFKMDGKLQATIPQEITNKELLEKYPYTLLTIHPMRSNHSQYYHIIEGIQHIKVEVSIDIAEQHGLQNGDCIRVFNDRGQVSGIIKVMKHSCQKIINIDEGQWRRFGGSVNLLTSDKESDNRLGSTIYDCLVNLEKV